MSSLAERVRAGYLRTDCTCGAWVYPTNAHRDNCKGWQYAKDFDAALAEAKAEGKAELEARVKELEAAVKLHSDMLEHAETELAGYKQGASVEAREADSARAENACLREALQKVLDCEGRDGCTLCTEVVTAALAAAQPKSCGCGALHGPGCSAIRTLEKL